MSELHEPARDRMVVFPQIMILTLAVLFGGERSGDELPKLVGGFISQPERRASAIEITEEIERKLSEINRLVFEVRDEFHAALGTPELDKRLLGSILGDFDDRAMTELRGVIDDRFRLKNVMTRDEWRAFFKKLDQERPQR